MNYEKKYNDLLQEIGMLRQLVAETEMTQNQIYRELAKIAPLMSKEQQKELDKHLKSMWTDETKEKVDNLRNSKII